MPLECKLCNISFLTQLEEKEHNLLLSHHVKLASIGSRVHNCAACAHNCQSLADYSKHVDTPDHRRKLERLRARIDIEERETPVKKIKTNPERMDNTYMEPTGGKKERKDSYSSNYSSRSNNKYSYEGYGYRNERSSDSYRDRSYSDKRYSDRSGSRSSYHSYSRERYPDSHYSKDKGRSSPPSPLNEEPKKNMFQRACNLSIRKKDKARKSASREEDDKITKSTTEKKGTPKMSGAVDVQMPLAIQVPKKKRDVVPGPSMQNQTEKQKSWKKLAKSVIGKKQSDLVRRDRASKYRLLDKKSEELSEEDGIMSELPASFQASTSVNTSLYNLMNDSSATYASVTNFPISTPYNYPNAIRAYESGTDNLSQVLGEIEKAKSVASTSAFSTPSSADTEVTVKPQLIEKMSNENIMGIVPVIIKDEVLDNDYFLMASREDDMISKKSADVDKKNELWDLAMEEEKKKRELEVFRGRVRELESDLLRISKRKTELLEL